MGLRKVQMSCAAGEVSPSMFGRFDDQKYQSGLAKCRNFIVRPQGPAVVRPGTSFVNTTKYSNSKCRLIPFTFSLTETMVLELGHGYIRFHTNGRTLMSGSRPYEISSPYAAEDLADIHYVQSMDVMTLVHPKYAPRELRRYGNTNWELVTVDFGAPLFPPNAPTVSYTVVAAKDVTITEAEKTRYTLKYKVTAIKRTMGGTLESEASPIGSCQGNLYLNNATCTISWTAVSGAEGYRVYKNYKGMYCYIGETLETSFIDDNYEPDASVTPPRYDDPFNVSHAIVSATVTNGGSGYTEEGVITGIASSGTIVSSGAGVGFPIKAQRVSSVSVVNDSGSNGGGATVSINYGPDIEETRVDDSGDSPTTVTVYYKNLLGLNLTAGGRGYSSAYVKLNYTDANGAGREAKFACTIQGKTMINVTDATGYGAVIEAVVAGGRLVSANIVSGGRGYTAPRAEVVGPGSGATVTLGVGKEEYPGAVCYFEQRKCFAGTLEHPQTVWMTRSGTESDMSYTLPSKDDNRLRFQLAAQEASRILHLIPVSMMLALTNSTEYRVSSGGSEPMSPTNISSKVQAQIGASSVMPVVVNSSIVYASSRNGHVRELGYNWQSSGFTTGDLSIRSEHFFETARVCDMTLTKAPDSIVWCAMTDGSLLGLTYLPEQGVGGWHSHSTVHGAIESVTSVPEGDEDALYMVVRREINGQTVRYVERMHERHFADLEDAWCVDCGGEYRGEATTTVTGLNWLEGETVSILADGCVLPQRVVKDGTVTLTQPSKHVIVGLPITADLQTLPVAVQMQDGSYGTGHMKNVNDIYLRVYKSSGIFMGPDFDNLVEVKQRTTEPYGSPPRLVSQEVSVMAHCQWNDSGQICIRQKDPLPLTIVSISWDLAQ